ncbi:MAG: hypothetical protein IJR68_01825 [Fretibacterium sp.]|nr:hypothetical protein [Fretibacterium sp.]
MPYAKPPVRELAFVPTQPAGKWVTLLRPM